MRYLQTVNFIRRIAQPGSRRDRYEFPDYAWYLAIMNDRPIYSVLATLAESAYAAIDEPGSDAATRAADLAAFYRFLEARLPEVMEEWESIRTQR